jgi:hypothetical protein
MFSAIEAVIEADERQEAACSWSLLNPAPFRRIILLARALAPAF